MGKDGNCFDLADRGDYDMAMLRVVMVGMLVLAVALLAASRWFAPKQADIPASISYGKAAIGGSFSLTDHHGKPFTESNLKGHYALVYFGFTHCPDICPTGLMVISNSLNALGDQAKQVLPVFITVDPERDTQKVMAEYVTHFHPRLIGLTGRVDAIQQAANAYKVYFSKVEQKDSALGYLVDHSGFIYLMNPEGDYLAHFPHTVTEAALTAALRQHLPQGAY